MKASKRPLHHPRVSTRNIWRAQPSKGDGILSTQIIHKCFRNNTYRCKHQIHEKAGWAGGTWAHGPGIHCDDQKQQTIAGEGQHVQDWLWHRAAQETHCQSESPPRWKPLSTVELWLFCVCVCVFLLLLLLSEIMKNPDKVVLMWSLGTPCLYNVTALDWKKLVAQFILTCISLSFIN